MIMNQLQITNINYYPIKCFTSQNMFYRTFLETLVWNSNYEDIVVGSSQISTFNFSAQAIKKKIPVLRFYTSPTFIYGSTFSSYSPIRMQLSVYQMA